MWGMHTCMCLLPSLSWNKISDEGPRALGEALKVNTTLTSLMWVSVCIHYKNVIQGCLSYYLFLSSRNNYHNCVLVMLYSLWKDYVPYNFATWVCTCTVICDLDTRSYCHYAKHYSLVDYMIATAYYILHAYNLRMYSHMDRGMSGEDSTLVSPPQSP